MYEKPQYLTPNGYKRLSANPHTTKAASSAKKAVVKAPNLALPKTASLKPMRRGGIQISDKSAKLIADALRIMLKS